MYARRLEDNVFCAQFPVSRTNWSAVSEKQRAIFCLRGDLLAFILTIENTKKMLFEYTAIYFCVFRGRYFFYLTNVTFALGQTVIKRSSCSLAHSSVKSVEREHVCSFVWHETNQLPPSSLRLINRNLIGSEYFLTWAVMFVCSLPLADGKVISDRCFSARE